MLLRIGLISSWEEVLTIILPRLLKSYIQEVIRSRKVAILKVLRHSMRITLASWLRCVRMIWSANWVVLLHLVVTSCSRNVPKWMQVRERCWFLICLMSIMVLINLLLHLLWPSVKWTLCTDLSSWTGMVGCSWMLRHVMTGHPLCQKRIVLISILLLAYLL